MHWAKIRWNKRAVYDSLGGPPNNWPEAKVDQNMFTKYTLDKVQATPFDPKSVMLYFFPAAWTIDGQGTSFNPGLSDRDKEYIAFCYPKPALDAGQFNTSEVRPWDQPQISNKKFKYLHKTYPNPPRIAVGLTWLDVDHSKNLRISAKASDVTTANFNAELNAWSDTILYGAGMSYLELGSAFDYVETGTFNTQDIRPWDKPQLQNSKRIDFSKAFEGSAPKVVCWINSMDFDHTKNARITVSATDIDTKGFTAHIDSWADTVLYSAGITWIAYPSTKQGVASGTFSTHDVRPWHQPRAENSGSVSFGNAFHGTPKLIMGLNNVDYDCNKNLRFRCSTSSVTQSGFVWHLQSWADSVMYSTGASWFAWT